MTKAVKYRKKPAIVEARRLTRGGGKELAAWCGGRAIYEPKASDPTDVYEAVEFPTLEGNARAEVGDWIIRGTQGELQSIGPSAFEEIYERMGVRHG